jgi:hypothetical protein
MTEKLARGTTVWGAAHLPQNRDVFMAHSGDGEVALYRYRYPDQRKVKVGAPKVLPRRWLVARLPLELGCWASPPTQGASLFA